MGLVLAQITEMDVQHVHGLVPLLFHLLHINLGGAALGNMDLEKKRRKNPVQHHPAAVSNMAKRAWRGSAVSGKTNFLGRNPKESGLGLLICKPRLFPRLPVHRFSAAGVPPMARGLQHVFTSVASEQKPRNKTTWTV